MLRLSKIVLITTTGVLLFGLLAPLSAEGTDAIYIANQVVARIRTPGSYNTVFERSATVDKAIAEVISTQDTQDPQVRVAMKDGKWSVYCGAVRIISVYPEEAKTNNISAKTLAQIWAKNIKIQLPLTTPKSKMPADATLPPVPVTKSDRPTPTVNTREESGKAGSTMSRSAALLLTIDAFNVVRALSEEDYLSRREEIARNLLKNLRPFMGGEAPAVEPAPAAPAQPVTGREEVGPPTPPLVQETEPAASEVSVETIAIPPIQEGDPAYARVPQKNRIKTKFALIQDPYLELVTSDPQAAAPIGELLKAARAARAAENFDECESYLDHALGLLGVAYEQ